VTQNLFKPLSQSEIEELDRFLLERIDEGAVTENSDEGVFCVSELDGLFTAVVSGPVMIPPSGWLPAVWGDFEPVWDDMAEFERIFSLMFRLMNEISRGLHGASDDYGPLFNVRQVDDREVTVVDEWCEGYLRGIDLAAEEWNLADEELQTLLLPIVAFTEVGEWEAHDSPDFPPIEKVQELIAPTTRAVFEYWLERRTGFPSDNGLASTPVARSEPKVGRNDPCPCGSGKKFKKCCLH
jgi:uncharacterized protein